MKLSMELFSAGHFTKQLKRLCIRHLTIGEKYAFVMLYLIQTTNLYNVTAASPYIMKNV